MDKSKLNRITSKMQEKGLSQMIISDPVSIFYLVEKWIFPGERFHALYINTKSLKRLQIIIQALPVRGCAVRFQRLLDLRH